MKMHHKKIRALSVARPVASTSGVRAPIVIALGANLPSRFGPPQATLEAALQAMGRAGLRVYRRSAWYRSAAVPRRAGPPFTNGIALVETMLAPAALLAALHGIERRFGRRRRRKNEPRGLDLDLIDFHGRVAAGPPVLPHPRAHLRAFVLLPLAEVAPAWRHPVIGKSARDLVRHVPFSATCRIGGKKAGKRP